MKSTLHEEKVFKDPVHKYVYVQDEPIWDLINTSEFQRLRRIRQLGTSFFTFHGAEHSRFSHSLGVYEITRKIISQFERNAYPDWPEQERLLCLCSALLHDIGHGPFSHSIEQAFGMHHEDWTCRIVLENTEVHRILAAIAPDFPERIVEVIRKTYREPIVVSLISSQMDADRMDYLLRDAYFTGVNYGTFDIDRILRMMRPYKGHIVVKESGMHAVEDYLMSRYQMYWQVYFHPVTRSSEIVLHKLIRRAKALFADRYPFKFIPDALLRLFERNIATAEYLQLDEALMQMVFMQWTSEKDPILADLCGRFMNRRLFKYVALDAFDETELNAVREFFAGKGFDPDYYIEIDFPTDLPYDVYRPGEPIDEGDGHKPIMLLDNQDNVVEITRKSEIVRSISGIHQGKYHLYYPGEALEGVGRSAIPKLFRQ